jgi:hypothetical protein
MLAVVWLVEELSELVALSKSGWDHRWSTSPDTGRTAVSDSDFPFSRRAPTEGRESLSLQVLTARAQRLIDAPRPVRGYPLEWHVEASHVGDLTAIAVAALRSRGSSPAG